MRLQRAEDRTVLWGKLKIHITADPMTIRVEDYAGEACQRLAFDAKVGWVNFALGDTPVFGLGEGGHQFDRRGVVERNENGKHGPDAPLNGSRVPIPWLISPAGWALYFNHPQGIFDLTGDTGVFRPAEPPQSQDLFLILSKDPAELLREYALLTGMPYLPPIWALGFQQSHRTLTSRESVMHEIKAIRDKELPCDVLIYLGTGYAPSGWNEGHASFAFNRKIFPDPKAMFQEMHRQNFSTVLHVLGAPHDLHGRVTDLSPDPDNAANYWRTHLDVFRSGIDGWWVDDGDELSPESRLVRNQMYWEGSLHERQDVRPYALHRNAYSGLQRYGFLWSGDINSSWETLRTQVANGINTGLSGIPWWGTDTGGFFTTSEFTAELFLRWFQFSAFCPLFRSHGRTWHLRAPWGWNTGDPGPIEDDASVIPPASSLHNPEVEIICRKYLNLRYRLLSYLYSAAYEAHTTGMPIMRALWIHDPLEAKAARAAATYLWGRSILVAPVTSPSVDAWTFYLPQSGWFDFWTNQLHTGGVEITRDVDLTTLPLYIKAGSILPLSQVRQSTAEAISEPLEIIIYPGADAHFALYEDDGITMRHQRGAFSIIHPTWTDRTQTLSIALDPHTTVQPRTTRHMVVRLAGSAHGTPVSFTGRTQSILIGGVPGKPESSSSLIYRQDKV
jgi:alpha-glucosidase/alpha-D-xyloside xylohydrolase